LHVVDQSSPIGEYQECLRFAETGLRIYMTQVPFCRSDYFLNPSEVLNPFYLLEAVISKLSPKLDGFLYYHSWVLFNARLAFQ
jgi:hypothetical protein